jgi:hypothetical protein
MPRSTARFLAEVGAEALGQAPIVQQLAALADKVDQLLPRQPGAAASPAGSVDAAIAACLRGVAREEIAQALADHRAHEQEREDARLAPLPEVAKKLGVSAKGAAQPHRARLD